VVAALNTDNNLTMVALRSTQSIDSQQYAPHRDSIHKKTLQRHSKLDGKREVATMREPVPFISARASVELSKDNTKP